jgi:prepilin-type N-terminal cleavage/methylation domain-containing protein
MKRRKGFTLIELLVVLAIIATITGSALVITKVANKRRFIAVKQTMDYIAYQLDRYYETKGNYPSNIQDFLGDTLYFRTVPIDPYTNVPLADIGDRLVYDVNDKQIGFKDPEGNLIYATSFKASSFKGVSYSIPNGSTYGGGDAP